jgi:predicted dehydrogenase
MINVGIIGAGFIGRNHFNQYEKLKDRCRVVMLCDKEAERRAGDWSEVGGNVGDTQGTKRDLGNIRPCSNWTELVSDPEVHLVDVCAPTFLHAEIAVAALRAGKHVLCEKPMALDLAECDAMLEADRQSPGKFMIAQCIRFWPQYVYLKQAYADQRFGALKSLHLRRQASTPGYTLNNWIVNPAMSGGAILDLHVHDVDYALYLLGKPNSVHAQAYQREGGAFDRVHAIWDYGPNRVVQLEGYWDMPPAFGFDCGFTAVFERGAVEWNLASGKPLAVFLPDGKSETPDVGEHDGYYGEIEYFLGCIERGEDPRTSTPQQSRTAVAIALAEKDSASRREPVKIS